MLWKTDEVACMPDFRGVDYDAISMMLDAIEDAIRAYTGENFQVRTIRQRANMSGNAIAWKTKLIRPGDTVQISKSKYNDGIYAVETVEEDAVIIKGNLLEDRGLITKVQYPKAIKKGALDLLRWEVNHRDKVGVKRETISRHSIEYFSQDANNTVQGYPVSLMKFADPWRKEVF